MRHATFQIRHFSRRHIIGVILGLGALEPATDARLPSMVSLLGGFDATLALANGRVGWTQVRLPCNGETPPLVEAPCAVGATVAPKPASFVLGFENGPSTGGVPELQSGAQRTWIRNCSGTSLRVTNNRTCGAGWLGLVATPAARLEHLAADRYNIMAAAEDGLPFVPAEPLGHHCAVWFAARTAAAMSSLTGQVAWTSTQGHNRFGRALDGRSDTLWVSVYGPTSRAEWFWGEWERSVALAEATLVLRPDHGGYSPNYARLVVNLSAPPLPGPAPADGSIVHAGSAPPTTPLRAFFPPSVHASNAVWVFLGAYDRGVTHNPRNIQGVKLLVAARARPGTYGAWGLHTFTLDRLDDPDWIAPQADSDQDGTLHLWEFITGTDPCNAAEGGRGRNSWRFEPEEARWRHLRRAELVDTEEIFWALRNRVDWVNVRPALDSTPKFKGAGRNVSSLVPSRTGPAFLSNSIPAMVRPLKSVCPSMRMARLINVPVGRAANDVPCGPTGLRPAARCIAWPFRWLTILGAAHGILATEPQGPSLDDGFDNPPPEARLRAYWWWLNGNVTAEAITRDLEAMKAKGFAGAILCDADGSNQDGNARVPHGATFLSPQWLKLYRHALDEAARLGLEISLQIQSGWNLGGPMVTQDDAPKKVVWTFTRVTGPTKGPITLLRPEARDGYYRDLYVLAYPWRLPPGSDPMTTEIRASSHQQAHPPSHAIDGDPDTWWVSGGTEPGDGPRIDRPEWLELRLTEPFTAEALVLQPRPGYGPREVELAISDDGERFQTVRRFRMLRDEPTRLEFPAVQARLFRVRFLQARDPRFPAAPRNVQVAELWLEGPAGFQPSPAGRVRPLKNWAEKAMHRTLEPFSAPDSRPLMEEWPELPGEFYLHKEDILDLTDRLGPDGQLRWDVPDGEWEILRLGCTLNDHCYVSTCSQGWEGYAIDPFDADAFTRYWDTVVEKLLEHAGPHVGRTLKYLHTDSWEVEVANWTPTLPREFQRRRGYDLTPWLPVLAGRIVNSREESNRFLNDFRRTFGELAIDHHYRLFRDRAHQRGLLIHPESGGPHAVPIDAQQCLGFNDVPMSEFWAWSWRHRIGDANRFFVKQPASAAHTYGRRFVMAEGFTTIGPHWQETLWDNLKPSFDKACTEGLNVLVWHTFVCSPKSEGIPGQQYFAGTHLNPQVTWWEKSKPFFDYINRCQFLLQQGLFVADVAFYYGDHVPNFAQLKSSDPAGILPGYDYDVVTAEVLLERMEVRHGRFVLPDGMSYRILVLRNLGVISPPVLRRLKSFLEQGGIIVGQQPRSPGTLTGHPAVDDEFHALVRELWGPPDAPSPRLTARGPVPRRVIADRNPRQVLEELGLPPDFEWEPLEPGTPAEIDFIHRRTEAADIYFVAHRGTNATQIRATFRVAGKAPELWDPVTGARRFLSDYEIRNGRTSLPLDFAPCGSWFVVFRHPAEQHPPTGQPNHPHYRPVQTLTAPWKVQFDPAWSDLTEVTWDRLMCWTQHPHPDIRHYSGTARYHTTFDWAPPPDATGTEVWLDLGDLRELAEVYVNGRSCGIVWTPPFRVRLDPALRPGENQLTVEVVNFWPNRIIGDAALPVDQRRTRTNIRRLTPQTPLMRSGLFGPVQLLVPGPIVNSNGAG